MSELLAFDDLGEGPAVLLIHGHPFDRSMWQPQHRSLLDAGFRVVAPDLRGYGESEATPGTVTMGELADDLLALLDRLGIERFAAVGLSMGGLVAMELATRSERLWALALVATTAEPLTEAERERRLRLAAAAEAEGMTPLVEAMRDLVGPDCPQEVVEAVETMMRRNNPLGAAAALRGRAERPDYRTRLKTLRLPTLICAGTADRFSTAEVTQELIDCLPAAATLVLPEVGHLPNLEAADEFNHALIQFLRSSFDLRAVANEALMTDTGAGVVPQSEGWFIVNVRDAAWLRNDTFGARCTFETDGHIVQERPQLHLQQHPHLGIRLHVLERGKPTTMYHRESEQEDFLVLTGACLLIVEGEERLLRAWDLFHCAPNTAHSFVGASDEPCVMLMVGARNDQGTILYARDETALALGAAVEHDTPSPQQAYASFPHWRLGRPESWDKLPWA